MQVPIFSRCVPKENPDELRAMAIVVAAEYNLSAVAAGNRGQAAGQQGDRLSEVLTVSRYR